MSHNQFKYGCILINLDIPNWSNLISFVPEEDQSIDGMELNPHVTVLYGIHPDVPDDQIAKIVSQIDTNQFKLEINGVGLFDRVENDVLKFNVECVYLRHLNSLFRELPHTSDFPDYNPHITIGFIKTGFGKKYMDVMEVSTIGVESISISNLVYNKPNGEKIEYSIGFVE